jgi:hypothetical protein
MKRHELEEDLDYYVTSCQITKDEEYTRNNVVEFAQWLSHCPSRLSNEGVHIRLISIEKVIFSGEKDDKTSPFDYEDGYVEGTLWSSSRCIIRWNSTYGLRIELEDEKGFLQHSKRVAE